MISQSGLVRRMLRLPVLSGSAFGVALGALLLLSACMAGGGSQGEKTAPAFSLASVDHGQVSLGALLEKNEGAVLVFYRGFF